MIVITIILLFLPKIFSVEPDRINVGTVLFSPEEIKSVSWSANNVGLLRARRYFQHLIPPPSLVDPSIDHFADTILDYFTDAVDYIKRDEMDPLTSEILTTAVSDIIGGYMKAFVIPVAKYGYYGGTVTKDDAQKIYQFYDDIMEYLKTNGSQWRDFDGNFVKPLNIIATLPTDNSRSTRDYCAHLTFYEETPSGYTIPLPTINFDTQSPVMYVPLKGTSIIDLDSPNSSGTLLNYYQAAKKCLKTRNPSTEAEFDYRFHTWLTGDVIAHIGEEDNHLFYALGGILTLANVENNMTKGKPPQFPLKHLGQIKKKLHKPYLHINFASKKIMILAILLFLEVVWCIPALLYMLYTRRKKKRRGSNLVFVVNPKKDSTNFCSSSESESESETPQIYCDDDTCDKLKQCRTKFLQIKEAADRVNFKDISSQTSDTCKYSKSTTNRSCSCFSKSCSTTSDKMWPRSLSNLSQMVKPSENPSLDAGVPAASPPTKKSSRANRSPTKGPTAKPSKDAGLKPGETGSSLNPPLDATKPCTKCSQITGPSYNLSLDTGASVTCSQITGPSVNSSLNTGSNSNSASDPQGKVHVPDCKNVKNESKKYRSNRHKKTYEAKDTTITKQQYKSSDFDSTQRKAESSFFKGKLMRKCKRSEQTPTPADNTMDASPCSVTCTKLCPPGTCDCKRLKRTPTNVGAIITHVMKMPHADTVGAIPSAICPDTNSDRKQSRKSNLSAIMAHISAIDNTREKTSLCPDCPQGNCNCKKIKSNIGAIMTHVSPVIHESHVSHVSHESHDNPMGVPCPAYPQRTCECKHLGKSLTQRKTEEAKIVQTCNTRSSHMPIFDKPRYNDNLTFGCKSSDDSMKFESSTRVIRKNTDELIKLINTSALLEQPTQSFYEKRSISSSESDSRVEELRTCPTITLFADDDSSGQSTKTVYSNFEEATTSDENDLKWHLREMEHTVHCTLKRTVSPLLGITIEKPNTSICVDITTCKSKIPTRVLSNATSNQIPPHRRRQLEARAGSRIPMRIKRTSDDIQVASHTAGSSSDPRLNVTF